MSSTFEVISPDVLKNHQMTDRRARLIDVRDLDEYAAVHVDGAECVPLPRLLSQASQWSPDECLVLICHSGQRARQAAAELQNAGFRSLRVVDGGTKACIAAEVSVVRGKRMIPLPRQVFMAMGTVLLLELALATFVHPWLIALCWLTGGAMIVAGYTGFCPMSSMIAAMPWNRPRGTGALRPSGSCVVSGDCS
ncbi:MAG: rhodanese-like domain-containing protein [Phycisphaerae bacterium]|nr:rhodanese-like domain-containing protein [Phycisphaerae bacterium]